ncbi:hypothetical protein ACW9HW_10255 [Pseudomonas sp. SDO5532_S415]
MKPGILTAQILVGATVRRFDLLAKAVCQTHHGWMGCRLREQARSHKGFIAVIAIGQKTTITL